MDQRAFMSLASYGAGTPEMTAGSVTGNTIAVAGRVMAPWCPAPIPGAWGMLQYMTTGN